MVVVFSWLERKATELLQLRGTQTAGPLFLFAKQGKNREAGSRPFWVTKKSCELKSL
jgi:hypothetical protein